MKKEFDQISKILNEAIIEELELQGHLLLDELESTIRGNVKVRDQKNLASVEASAVAYIQKMEWGTRVSELGSPVQHLKALYEFYHKIGYSEKKALVKAKRLLPHHFREGTPTEFSKIYSKTGERKFFIQAAWKKKEAEVDKLTDQGMDVLFNNEFNLQKSEII